MTLIFTAFFQASQGADNSTTEDLTGLSLAALLEVEITTVATGEEQTLSEAPGVVSIITAQDIKAMGAHGIDEVLKMIPGLHVSRSAMYNPIFAIRGIYQSDLNNPEVLILINGIPISTLFSGTRTPDWGGMPVKAIKRIEVIRGPGSALYGAEAFAGVINIITKGSEDIEGTEVGLQAGSFNTRGAWVLHGGNYKGLDMMFSLEYNESDGPDGLIAEDKQTAFDRIFHTNASLAPGQVNRQTQQVDIRTDVEYQNWQFRAGYQTRELGMGAGIASALDHDGRRGDESFNADLTYHNPTISESWDVTAQLNFLEVHPGARPQIRFFPPGAFGGAFPNGMISGIGSQEDHAHLDLYGFYTGFTDHTLRVGLGYHYGKLGSVTDIRNFCSLCEVPPNTLVDFSDTPFSLFPEGNRKNSYVSLQDVWKINAGWTLTTGMRYDTYSDVGSTFNPRLALVWQTSPTLTTKIMYGSAFRAPSFFELYVQNPPIITGNSELKSETIDTFELAFAYYPTKTWHLGLNLYTYQAKDKVFTVPTEGHGFMTKNFGRWDGQGFELEVSWKPRQTLEFLGSYALQRSVDKETDHDVGQSPQQQLYLQTDWNFHTFFYLNTQVTWIADRERAFGDPRPSIDDYTTVDLTLRTESENPLGITVGVRNLFDADVREPSIGLDSDGIVALPYDLPQAGRNYFAEIQYRF
ncbi:MAG: hypothetical protein BWK79_14255 [Beggiatoa sp. IS2]|nr:MAG: hypothetical protein BWK79_14255 [Beggiatoa sp. IS2]